MQLSPIYNNVYLNDGGDDELRNNNDDGVDDDDDDDDDEDNNIEHHTHNDEIIINTQSNIAARTIDAVKPSDSCFIEMPRNFAHPSPLITGMQRIHGGITMCCDSKACWYAAFRVSPQGDIAFVFNDLKGNVEYRQLHTTSLTTPVMGIGPNNRIVCGLLVNNNSTPPINSAAWILEGDLSTISMHESISIDCTKSITNRCHSTNEDIDDDDDDDNNTHCNTNNILSQLTIQHLNWKAQSAPAITTLASITYAVYVNENGTLSWRSLTCLEQQWTEEKHIVHNHSMKSSEASIINTTTCLHAPSVYAFNDSLVCLWSQANSGRVFESRFNGEIWSTPRYLDICSEYAPSLSEFEGRLYAVFQCLKNQRVFWMYCESNQSNTNGDSMANESVSVSFTHDEWSTPTSTLLSSYHSPAITTTLDGIICLISEANNHIHSLLYCRMQDLNVYPTSWMKDMKSFIEHIPLIDIALPGTHDSATYGITPQSGMSPDGLPWYETFSRIPIIGYCVRRIVRSWARTQERTVAQQLCDGIRYFDLRVAARAEYDNEFWIVHSMYSIPLRDVLDDVAAFVDTNCHEIVLLDFNHFYCMTQQLHIELISLLIEILGTRLAPYSIGTRVSPSQLWHAGFNIIAFYEDMQVAHHHLNQVWPLDTSITSKWVNAPTTKALMRDLKQHALNQTHDHRFHVTQGQITPDTKTVIRGVAPLYPGSLLKMTRRTNAEILPWIHEEWANSTFLNIVIVDHYHLHGNSLVETLMHLNRIRGLDMYTKHSNDDDDEDEDEANDYQHENVSSQISIELIEKKDCDDTLHKEKSNDDYRIELTPYIKNL